MGFTPAEFWEMTPREMVLCVEARLERDIEMGKLNLRLAAQLAAWILSPYSTRPLTADDLLGGEIEEDYWAIKCRIKKTRERFGNG